MSNNKQNAKIGVFLCFFSGLILLPVVGWAVPIDSARWLPEETMAYVQVASVSDLRETFKKSTLYGLYKDPAMHAFIVPAEENIRKKIDDELKKAWQKIHLEEPPEEIPWPQGEIIAAVFLQSRSVMMPDYSQFKPQAGQPAPDFESLPKVERLVQDFQIVALADMGENIQSLRKLARDVSARAVEDGAIRQRESIRGVEINIIKQQQDQDEDFDTLCYGFKDTWLIAGSSLKYIREVLVRMDQSDQGSLAARRDLRETAETLGDADVFFYVNARTIKDVILAMTPAPEKDRVAGIIKTLGLENVQGLGATFRIAPSKREEFMMKALLSVPGEKTGLMALLTPATSSLRINRLLSKGLAEFTVMNYDPARIYNDIVLLAWNIGQINIDNMIQMALAVTGQPEEGGRPPVNFKEQVIGQLTGPVMITSRFDKPYTDADSAKSLLALAVRDGEVLDTALARMHSVFIAQGDQEMRRELNNCTIYLLPPIPGLFGGMISPDDGSPAQVHLALSVVGDQLVFGTERVVEQAIRDLGREDIERINTDPMYQYASGRWPAQAGGYYYENGQITGQVLWETLKEAARQAAQQPSTKSTDDENEIVMGVGLSSQGLVSPVTGLISELEKYVDFTTLPEFASVKKYFGVTIGYVVGNDKGIYAELVELKTPGAFD